MIYSAIRATACILLFVMINYVGYSQCDPADTSFIYVSSINASGPGDDNVVICNSSVDEYNLIGVMLVDSDPSQAITIDIMIPAFGCVTLDELDLGFKFSGGGDSFTITCMDGTEFLSITYTAVDANGFAIFPGAQEPPIGPCDASVTSLYVFSLDPQGRTDDVVICNDSPDIISLAGAFGSDKADDEDDMIGLISVPAYGCVSISGSFGLSSNSAEEFFLICDGTVLASLPYDPTDPNISFPFTAAGVTMPVAPATNIPTMGEWGLMSLGLLILIIGAVKIREEDISIA